MPTEAGSIADIQRRLSLWCQRQGRGLARVEYSSEFARQRVVADLQRALAELGIPFHEIILPFERPPAEVIPLLLDKLTEAGSGVVSITGLGSAFSKDVPLIEPLQILNFNRERIAAFPARQIWWMPPALVRNIVHSMPDLNSWFSPRLYLMEVIKPAAAAFSLQSSTGVNLEDARQRAQRLWERFQAAQAEGISINELLTNYASPAIQALYEAGALREAEALLNQIQKHLPQTIDFPESLETADFLEARALLEIALGHYEQAAALLPKSLELRKKFLGEEHPNVATSLNNLAGLYYSQGRYDEAEPLFQQALGLRRKLLGEEHPDVATSLNNLANLYSSQGRYDEAEPLLQQALRLVRKLGEEHPKVATSLNNLAGLYYSQGRYEQAEPLYVQALGLRRKLLGEEHPDVATSLNNLAELYSSQGRYEEAEPLLVRALAIRERVLGVAHPYTVATRRWLERVREG
nr:tetratricopeptide repeat protein [Anthocerotibacter panamensis]